MKYVANLMLLPISITNINLILATPMTLVWRHVAMFNTSITLLFPKWPKEGERTQTHFQRSARKEKFTIGVITDYRPYITWQS